LGNEKKPINKNSVLFRRVYAEGFTPPFANAMAMMAAASMTHERGFHIKPKNLSSLLS